MKESNTKESNMKQLTLIEWVAKYTGTRYHEVHQITQHCHEPELWTTGNFRRSKPTKADIEFIGDIHGGLQNVSMTVGLSPGSLAYAEFMTITDIRRERIL